MRNRIFVALAAAAVAAVGAPAFAQTVQEVTVTAQWGGRGEPPQTLTRVVGYDDLDLRRAGDQAVLGTRVRTTAHAICNELGEEHPNRANLGRSCEERAVKDAMAQVRVAVADAMTRGGPAYAAVAAPTPPAAAPSAEASGQPASYTVRMVTNGPVPDTPENRAKYGGPMSHAGKHTKAAGN